MELYIYRLEGCKTCLNRQGLHNQIAQLVKNSGIDTIGVRYGMVEGKRVEPLEKHDALCRKPEDQTKYTAPIYILEMGDDIVKLPDAGQFPSAQEYVQEILRIANDVMSSK